MGVEQEDSIPIFNFKVMARKKNVEETPVLPQDSVVEGQSVEAPAVVDEEASAPAAETVKQVTVEPSEQIKKLLRCYFNYAVLYVDSKGGVYPEGTQPNLVGDAILYQNPYYKS